MDENWLPVMVPPLLAVPSPIGIPLRAPPDKLELCIWDGGVGIAKGEDDTCMSNTGVDVVVVAARPR
jgi:hypothetical protein